MAYPPFGALGAAQQDMRKQYVGQDKDDYDLAFQRSSLSHPAEYAGRPPFFAELTQHAAVLDQLLNQIECTLSDVRFRVLGGGANVAAGSMANQAERQPPNLRDATMITMGDLADLARRILDHAEAMNGSL